MATKDTSSRFRGSVWLSYAVFGGPIAWLVHILLRYPLVPMACEHDRSILLHGVTIAMLCMTVGAAATALALYRRAEAPLPPPMKGGRRRDIALVGLMSSSLFAAVIVAEWLPAVLQDPCVDQVFE